MVEEAKVVTVAVAEVEANVKAVGLVVAAIAVATAEVGAVAVVVNKQQWEQW